MPSISAYGPPHSAKTGLRGTSPSKEPGTRWVGLETERMR